MSFLETNGAGIFFANAGVFLALGMASKHYSFIIYLILDLGAAYGTAKAGIGIASMGVLKPDLIVKSIVPIVMAGILGIYGLIVAVILIQKCNWLIKFYVIFNIVGQAEYSTDGIYMKNGYQYFASGISCGFSSLVIIIKS